MAKSGAKPKAIVVAILIILSTVIIIGVRYAGGKKNSPESLDNRDALCLMATDRQMTCSQLAAPAVYDRGAIIRSPPEADRGGTIGLPTDHIFADKCAFSSDLTAFSRFHDSSDQEVAFGKHSFKIDRSLSAGATLALPKIAGLTLKAGPNLSDIRSITVEADSAQYFTIDSSSAKDVLGGCKLRPSCLSVLNSPNVRMIKSLLVAKNLKYRVETKSGETESLQAALQSKSISVGMEASTNVVSVDDLSSGKDMVFGISFFEPSDLRSPADCSEPLTIMKVTGETTADAISGAPGYSGEHKQDATGNEVSASAMAPDAPDRREGGMKDPEARAWGLWNYDGVKRELGLYARTLVDPGTRWLSDSNLHEIPGSLRVWAVPKSTLENQVEITLANASSETKTLYFTAHFDTNSSASLSGKRAMYSNFQPLTFISQDGTEHHVPPVWSGGEQQKTFELGRVGPGEVVKVRIGRKLQSVARTDDEAGTIQEDILLTFGLK